MSSAFLDLSFRTEPRPADCAAVEALVRDTGFFTPDEIGVAVELVQERLNKGIASGYEFLFAERNGQLLGYTCFGLIACTRASYDLYWIAVAPPYQGSGIGRALLEHSEALIQQAQGRRIYIETSSRAQYAPTRAFYTRCGYRQEALLEDFYAPGDAKVIYCKILTM